MRRQPTDTRSLARRLERHLAVWVVVFLIVVGGATIAIVYGPPAAVLGGVCLAGGAGLFALLYLILTAMERWANKE